MSYFGELRRGCKGRHATRLLQEKNEQDERRQYRNGRLPLLTRHTLSGTLAPRETERYYKATMRMEEAHKFKERSMKSGSQKWVILQEFNIW